MGNTFDGDNIVPSKVLDGNALRQLIERKSHLRPALLVELRHWVFGNIDSYDVRSFQRVAIAAVISEHIPIAEAAQHDKEAALLSTCLDDSEHHPLWLLFVEALKINDPKIAAATLGIVLDQLGVSS